MKIKRTPFQIQTSVIHALIERELKTRFGKYRLGYAWAILQPAIMVLTFYLLWSMQGTRTFGGVELIVFLITGFIPFFLFQSIIIQCSAAINSNKGLFNYRHVKPMDTFISRILLESMIYLATYILFLIVAYWVGYDISVDDPLKLVITWATIILMASGVGIFIGIISTFIKETDKILPVPLRIMFFTSGLFFPLSIIPSEEQQWLLWNPMLHAIETGRSALISSYETPSTSLSYPLMFAIVTLALGLSLYRKYRFRLVS